MSKEVLRKVVQRSINDAQFRRQLATDASAALSGYDLTTEEIGALRSRDAGKLTAFGVDTRMSKVFVDPGSMGAATVVTGGEPRDIAPVWVGDGAAHGGVQTPDAAERNAAFTTAGGSGVRDTEPVWIGDTAAPLHTFSGDDNAGPQMINTTGGEPRDVEPTWIGDNDTATGAQGSEGAIHQE